MSLSSLSPLHCYLRGARAAVSTLNMAITIHFNRREIQAVGTPVILAVASVSASRLVLNLRGATGRQQFQTDQTTIRFELQNLAKGRSAEASCERSTATRSSATVHV
ncbi:hypothetical protein BD311DRAFT_766079 [Dichomitus squalens]|uniref:Uncharacterized protein n=1 Tax=Dichomitus squalens TaxID=114155 RepID=A0A4V2JZD9_9APHY|nr:hypothetical protein BD311DRAFT_766079 [Dichomitus squalens]